MSQDKKDLEIKPQGMVDGVSIILSSIILGARSLARIAAALEALAESQKHLPPQPRRAKSRQSLPTPYPEDYLHASSFLEGLTDD